MRIPEWLAAFVSPLHRRLHRMPSEQMGAWVDVAGSEMSRAMTEYLSGYDPAALAEFDRGVATLVAMSEELHRRQYI